MSRRAHALRSVYLLAFCSMPLLGRRGSCPDVTAVDALWGVHTLQAAACRARPTLLFRHDERLDAYVADRLQVLKHAHPVLRAVPDVEPLESGARESVAPDAEARLT